MTGRRQAGAGVRGWVGARRAASGGVAQSERQRLRTVLVCFLREAARVPATWVVLLVVPVVFVRVAAPTLTDAARILAGASQRVPVDAVAAGWSAAFVTALAGFFQVFEGRTVDRRLALAGLPARWVTTGRLLTGLLVAAVAVAASLVTLRVSSTGTLSSRAVAATAASAVIYLAVGLAVGVIARTAVGGVTTILFVWILDTFFGPAMNGTTSPVTRVLPLHFVTLWLLESPTRHGGPEPWLGVVVWVLTALVVAAATLVLVNGLRLRSPRRHRWAPVPPSTPTAGAASGSATGSTSDATPSDDARGAPHVGRAPDSPAARVQVTTVPRRATRARARVYAPRGLALVTAGGRDMARTAALWSLLVVVPGVFIVLAAWTTPHGREPVSVLEAGRVQQWWFDPALIHAGTMAPVAIAALSMLVGVYVAADTRPGDQRLAWAGMPAAAVAGTRVLLAAGASVAVTVVSMAVTATLFTPARWAPYLAGNALLGVTYASLGVLMGARTGRVTGTFLAFLLPFLDVGLTQSPMLRAVPPLWASLLPGSAPTRVLLDGALTPGFDRGWQLLVAAAWAVLATLLAGAAVRRAVGTRHHPRVPVP